MIKAGRGGLKAATNRACAERRISFDQFVHAATKAAVLKFPWSPFRLPTETYYVIGCLLAPEFRDRCKPEGVLAETKLTGRYHVRVTDTVLNEGRKQFPRIRDFMRIRRHALKLRFWPDAPPGGSGAVLDLDWEWVKGLSSNDVGELRIHETISGCNNLRIIFHVGGKVRPEDELPALWILRVFQKKRDDFSTNDLAVFKQRRRNVRRFGYGE